MRVTRITIDADLGLIDLKTGPGGDGDYVLLPLEISEALQRYVTLAGEKCEAEAPETSIIAPGGWSVPADQAYDFNTTPGLGAYDAAISDPIQVERGGYKYPSGPRVGVEYTRSPELQKEFDKYLAAEVEEDEVTVDLTNLNGENVGTLKVPSSMVITAEHYGPAKEVAECDGDCGAHVKKGRADDVWTRAPGEGEPSKERHTGPATVPNPIRVFADEHSRGYRLHSPALPGWRADINQYDLYKVPGMIREALVDMGSDHAINYPVTITVMEEDQ